MEYRITEDWRSTDPGRVLETCVHNISLSEAHCCACSCGEVSDRLTLGMRLKLALLKTGAMPQLNFHSEWAKQ